VGILYERVLLLTAILSDSLKQIFSHFLTHYPSHWQVSEYTAFIRSTRFHL